MFFLFAGMALAENGRKRSTSQQRYQDRSPHLNRSGEANAVREVEIQEEEDATNVTETYHRQHRYQFSAPYQNPQTGAFHHDQKAGRRYYHHGDNDTKKKIDDFETNRLATLTKVDKLYTRAEKCKVFLQANPPITREQRDGFELEMDLIAYDIGEVAATLGTNAFRKPNPRERSAEQVNSLKRLDDAQWNLGPWVYSEGLQKYFLKDIDWELAYLKEIQRSLSTPYANSLPVKERDEQKESTERIDKMIKRLNELKI